MPLDQKAKKHALRLLHHNVAVVSAGKGDQAIGATVTWFMQSSFEPPFVALAIKADSRLYKTIKVYEKLVISLVAQDDKTLAGAFFKPGMWEKDTFGGFPAHEHKQGGVILHASPAWLAGEVESIIEKGDHHLVLVRITDAGIQNQSKKSMCLSETGWHYGG